MINIKATNMELTGAISDYINKRLESVQKFSKDGVFSGYVEVGKTTNHHNKGEFFKAEFDLMINGVRYFASSEKDNLYVAIDDGREEIIRTLTHDKDRKQTLFKRGAMSVKKMLKGISKRNPFTSKY